MIASLTGTVAAVKLDSVVLDVGGVGMAVQATPATLAGMRVGATARLATSYIKDLAPLPGRSFAFGVRAFF